MAETGKSAAEIRKSVSGANQQSVSRFSDADKLRNQVRSAMKEKGIAQLTEENIGQLPQSAQDAFNKMTTYQAAELGYQSQRQTTSFGMGIVNQGTQGAPGGPGASKEEKSVWAKLFGETGRLGDTEVKAMAADSSVVLDNFNEMSTAMKEAAETTAAWTRVIREANAALGLGRENGGDAHENRLKAILGGATDILAGKKVNATAGDFFNAIGDIWSGRDINQPQGRKGSK
jgi:hypothetical protein